MAKASRKTVAVAATNVITFSLLAETPGAVRYQEHREGTPLVNDADGAQIGGLYFRKALFDKLGIGSADKPAKSIKITVEIA